MAIVGSVKRLVRDSVEFLPKGHSLPEDVWRVRHRALSYLLRAHVVGIFAFAIFRGFGVVHSLVDTGAVAMFAVLAAADGRHRRVSSAMTALGLVVSSAMIVHLSGGVIEAHFHFFVMVGILTLYQDWQPFLLAIGFVVVHHAVLGTLDPSAVYNHPEAVAHPFKWALIHGAFVLAASIASVVAWRLNEEQAFKDSLTHLPNRRLFRDRVGHALARAQRRPATSAALFVDLDKFKDVNDSLGHPAGDQLLTTVAERLRAVVRPGDTVARLGGDEFAVLVEDIAGEDDAVGMAERLLAALAAPFVLRGKELTIGASIGIALSIPGDTVDELLRNADVAMYAAKGAGRGRFVVFEPDMHSAVLRRIEMEAYLRRAADAGEFILHYQPIIALGTGRLTGFEALLRWQHPVHGLRGPGAFLPHAEHTALMRPLTLHVLDSALGTWALGEACRQSRQWMDRFPGSQPLTMSVNLSPSQLFQPDIVDIVTAALDRTGLDPGNLILELTEGVMVNHGPVVADRLNYLKALGVQIAIDDFGTGYSSLSYLHRLPIDILKVDKTFIDDIAAEERDSTVARAIISLAQTMELAIVAEGVEHPGQVAELRELGCDFAQGYWFAKPLNVDGVEAMLGIATLNDFWLGHAAGLETTGPARTAAHQ
jgi:diguanylate cyclase (GGDEF)-like protein